MANFEPAYQSTAAIEGGYSNHPSDPGKETWKGVARARHETWGGWKIVDQIKNQLSLTDSDLIDHRECRKRLAAELRQNTDLNELIHIFYKNEFWDKFQGDNIIDQNVAEELYDTAVNASPGKAITILQEALNSLNRRATLYPDLVCDGLFGSKTNNAINVLYNEGDDEILYNIMNVLQGAYYVSLMKKNDKFEDFTRGWFKRVTIIK